MIFQSVRRILLGRPLATNEREGKKIGVIEGIPALGLDGLASSSYGPEALLTILIPLGVAGLHYLGPLILVILALLLLLYLSYQQTIGAYPNGGGSYAVARQNLGTNWGLIAAASLMLDYVLNVAVAISSGVAAIVSAFPSLHAWTLTLCLAVLVVVTLVNLRGTSEAGWALAVPTYLFVASFLVIIGLGIVQTITGGGHPTPVVPPPAAPAAAAGAAGAWLLMRAFASGCTAMTGVEAVANGTTAFREPAVKHARRTLTGIVIILGVLLAGIAYVARSYGVMAMHQHDAGYQSVLSQLTAAVVGHGVMYYVAMGGLLLVLALSANTSFVGFPRLCRLIANDDFLPHAFATVGPRLVYSIGILFLAGAAGLLLVAFKGITDRLIPLFAVGAFGAFTLSQAGMVIHWLRKRRSGGARGGTTWRLAINAAGGVATGVALLVIGVAKFVEGAWVTLLAIPLLILLFRLVKRHYVRVERGLRLPGPSAIGDGDGDDPRPPVILVPTEGWNRLTEKALSLALRLSPDVTAIHLDALAGDEDGRGTDETRLRERWAREVIDPLRRAGRPVPSLAFIHSPYRRFREPLVDFVSRVQRAEPTREVAVMLPSVVKRRWWQFVLHSYRVNRLRRALLNRGDSRTVLIDVPWHLAE